MACGFLTRTAIYEVPLGVTGSGGLRSLNVVGSDQRLFTDQTANVPVDGIDVKNGVDSPIHELGTYAPMIAGLAGVVLVARRRRRQS